MLPIAIFAQVALLTKQQGATSNVSAALLVPMLSQSRCEQCCTILYNGTCIECEPPAAVRVVVDSITWKALCRAVARDITDTVVLLAHPPTPMDLCMLHKQLETLRENVPGAWLYLPEFLRKFYVLRSIATMSALEQAGEPATEVAAAPDDGVETGAEELEALDLEPAADVAAAVDDCAETVADEEVESPGLESQPDVAAADSQEPQMREVVKFHNALSLMTSDTELTLQPAKPEVPYARFREYFRDAGTDNLKNLKWALVEYECNSDSAKAVIGALTKIDNGLL